MAKTMVDRICKVCQRLFQIEIAVFNKGLGHFCSPKCARKYQFANPEKRFWNKVSKILNGCWEWQGYCDPYGHFMTNRIKYPVHRYSWKLKFGEIPDSMFICHKCDNPSCVNPNHLFLGTTLDNMRDMIKKGRQGYGGIRSYYHRHPEMVRGEKNPRAKLTEKEIKEIRLLYKKDQKGYRIGKGRDKNSPTIIQLAEKYSVSCSNISSIILHKSWS